jgi:PAS domain S-box-containing protein
MRIRALLAVTLTFALLLVGAIGIASHHLSQRLAEVRRAQAWAQDRTENITRLLVLTQEYALHGEDRAAQQWKESLAVLSSSPVDENARPATGLPPLPEEVPRGATALAELFNHLEAASQPPLTPLKQRRQQLLLDQMLTNVTLLSEVTVRWSKQLEAEHEAVHQQLQRMNQMLPLAMLGLLALLAVLMVRRILLPLARFQEAVRTVASGDLTVRVASVANDELGELSRVFDAMAVDMVTDLRRQVAEREAAEDKARQVSRLYAVLSRCNHAIVHSRSADELFNAVCAAAVSLGGLKMAWIGMVDPETQLVRPVASFGDDAGYLATVQISVDSASPLGQGPTGTAIRDDQASWCGDIQTNPRTGPWHARAVQAGWQASAALPLHRDGRAVGALNLYAGEAQAFDDDIRQLLLELATDISFALDVFARDAERLQIAAALQESEAMFSLLLSQTPIYVFIKEVSPTESRVLRVSDNFIEMVGIASADMVGKTMEELFPPELAAKFTADDWAVVSKGEVLTLEETLNGRTYSTIKFPIVQAGKSLLAGYTIDITESKHAGELLLSQLDELRRWQQVMLGREERILAMKQEVNALLAEQGRPPRYQSAQDEGQEAAR